MSSDTIIEVQNLGKRYRIHHQQNGQRYTALRDVIAEKARSAFRGLWSRGPVVPWSRGPVSEDFWALKNVSFEVNRGDAIGIIGRNGAGKSTLLKILSRITEPTEGRVRLKGRVASLLEVGTGFHPELTGRENIFLNGAILGMSRAEIKKKFDEIVAFAEIEKFLDTPVKRYSSGMYVRLAFAVAAHLDPEILIVDEVLAVGDAEFQKKCLGKMEAVAKRGGRTVLFVSHNTASLRSLCNRGILLDHGCLVKAGEIGEVVDYYGSASNQELGSSTITFPKPSGHGVWIESASIIINGEKKTSAGTGDHFRIQARFRADHPVRKLLLGVLICSSQGERILCTNNQFLPFEDPEKPLDCGSITCDLGMVPLMEGMFRVSIWFGTNLHDQQHFPEALAFEVFERNIWGTQRPPPKHVAPLWWNASFSVENGK